MHSREHDTPPSSPRLNSDHDDDDDDDDGIDENGDMDIGDIEEIIELNDDTNFEEVAEHLSSLGGAPDIEDEEDASVTDMASTIFSHHKGSVFCCHISPTDSLAVTGGEDDLAYVWRLDTGHLHFTCQGHKDSVTCVCFSHDGSLVATGDMSGLIQVWKVDTSSKIWEFETGDLQWLTWHSGSHVLLAGTADGELWMWLVPHGHTKTFQSLGIPTQCGSLLRDCKRAAVAYDDGSVRVYDLKSGDILQTMSSGLGHSKPIACIDTHSDNNLIVTGSTDGTAKIYNSHSGKVLGTLDCVLGPIASSADTEEGDDSPDHTVEAASFCPSLPSLVVTATLAGTLTVWDISAQVERHTVALGCGTSKLLWNYSAPVVLAAGLDGAVRAVDVRTGQASAIYTGHTASVLDIAITKDNTKLVTTSEDGTARVYNM